MKRVCVFAGSNAGLLPDYEQKAAELGRLLAENGLELVYGGSRIGLMGRVADNVLTAGGKAIGVMPRNLFRGEIAHTGLTEFHEVGNMHERKALMTELADACIALPGGFGTFEELFEAVSWLQLGIHSKPVGILNVRGYYDPLIEMIKNAVKAGFMPETHTELIIVESEPATLLDRLRDYTPPAYAHKWTELPPEETR
ncbi:TIGR00730 family Rossman fold protein [Brevibacillus sp. SYP-B805]|uniref:LOG family protein n=1 Tax=Brevibacillus sp. SYP-B805 TaxID=1578199 RepID=UPI0013EB0F3C|nr:TIGR00730 family Rossman fold protein [Brevibacillus sp. SYP-B805]NGQ96471.1 TIGR00730 family Rossman fold protein [Brevibacillus sp. SYP-B805]